MVVSLENVNDLNLTKNQEGGERMSRRGLALLVVLVFFSLSLSGCFYFEAKKEIKNAEATLAQLKSAGGPTKATYEYCSAEAFLGMSRQEFNESDYKHARDFATRSNSAGQAGLAAVKK
jgi:hypothetical protein